jgi:hypothetical protein
MLEIANLKQMFGEDNIIVSPPIIDLETTSWVVCVMLKKDGKVTKLKNIPIDIGSWRM